MFRSFYRKFSAAADHYKVLGVSPTHKTSDIKLAYYKLAKMYHPDTTELPASQAARKFEAVGKAWEVLSNDLSRQKYDMERRVSSQTTTTFRSSTVKGQQGTWTFTATQFDWSDDDTADLEEWFSGLGFTASKLRDHLGKSKKKTPPRPVMKMTAHKLNHFTVKVGKPNNAGWGNAAKFAQERNFWKKPNNNHNRSKKAKYR